MQVRNTDAESVTEALNQVLALQTGGVAAAPDQLVTGTISDVFDGAAAGRRGATGRIVADPNGNLLLFHGSGREWAAHLRWCANQTSPSRRC